VQPQRGPALAPDPAWRSALRGHYESCFGAARILEEPDARTVRIDLSLHAPTSGRPYFTLATLGVSDRPLSVPHGAEAWRQLELVAYLPQHWRFDDEAARWPLRLLRKLGRFAHEYATFFAPGHTVPNGNPIRPFVPGSQLDTALLIEASYEDPRFTQALLMGRAPSFLNVVPITSAECELKLEHGVDALLRLAAQQHLTPVIDARRRCLVRGYPTARPPSRAIEMPAVTEEHARSVPPPPPSMPPTRAFPAQGDPTVAMPAVPNVDATTAMPAIPPPPSAAPPSDPSPATDGAPPATTAPATPTPSVPPPATYGTAPSVPPATYTTPSVPPPATYGTAPSVPPPATHGTAPSVPPAPATLAPSVPPTYGTAPSVPATFTPSVPPTYGTAPSVPPPTPSVPASGAPSVAPVAPRAPAAPTTPSAPPTPATEDIRVTRDVQSTPPPDARATAQMPIRPQKKVGAATVRMPGAPAASLDGAPVTRDHGRDVRAYDLVQSSMTTVFGVGPVSEKLTAASHLFRAGLLGPAMTAYAAIGERHPEQAALSATQIARACAQLGEHDRALRYYEVALRHGADPAALRAGIEASQKVR